MFKKKPQIKNLSPIRSSDRRKLADQIIAEFHVDVPAAPSLDQNSETSEPTTQPTLSSIRASLLPENCSSARFTTHAGADNKLVSGTVYVGAHPGGEERILWLQWGAREPRLYPTVYTLWQNPALVPLLHTPGIVVQKLKTGADLMTPGLIGGPPWPERATKNAIVAVASMEKPSVPVWLGSCEIDISSLGTVRGAKGKAVDGVHWSGDEIWSWGPTATVSGGRDEPEALEGWGDELADDRMNDRMKSLDMDKHNDEDDDDAQENGGVALRNDGNGEDHEPTTHEPTTDEIDQAFQQAFVYALYDAKKNGSPPHYGLDLPIQPSYLVANMIQPHLRTQSQHYTIKKTSWKNTKKFIKHLDKQKLVRSKDRNGGETVILDVDFEDQQIKTFIPYKLPKPRDENGASTTGSAIGNAEPALNQILTLQHLYRASSKLTPDVIPSKTDFYTSVQISNYIRTYIENSPDLTASTSSKRYIKINPFIANNILSDQSVSDARILAAGEIARDTLQKRVLDDHNLCVPFWILLKDSQKWDPESPDRSIPKPKSGPPPTVNVTIEKRTGTKTVTKITGLETFNISPQLMAPELQKKCASSTSVGQAVGGKPGMMEVLVQGDQREVVVKEVGRRGVMKEWVDVIDKTKKKSGQSGGGGGRR